MDELGFTSYISHRFEHPCYALTPALHDCKGMVNLMIKTIPNAGSTQETVTGSSDGNMTGSQSRTLLTMLERETVGMREIMCSCMQVLIFFRYQDIPVRYHYHEGTDNPYEKDFLYALLSYHTLIFLLEFFKAGVTRSSYAHSLEHWFDVEDAHRICLSDEAFEQCNGERKRWTVCTSVQTMERDLLAFELSKKHLVEQNCKRDLPELGPVDRKKLPVLYNYNTFHFHTCITEKDAVWTDAFTSLRTRVKNLGMKRHTCNKGAEGQKYVWDKKDKAGETLLICVCNEEPGVNSDDENVENVCEDKKKDDENGDHTCIICNTGFESSVGLFAHYDGKHRAPIMKCPFCLRETAGLSQHLLHAHAENLDKKTCPLCATRFSNARARDSHMKSAHS